MVNFDAILIQGVLVLQNLGRIVWGRKVGGEYGRKVCGHIIFEGIKYEGAKHVGAKFGAQSR